jgi:hypothetical protein
VSTWLWVIVGTGAFLFLSVVVSLAVAAVLSRVAQETTELLEGEFWSTASLTREKIRKEQEAPAKRQAASEQLGARGSHQ